QPCKSSVIPVIMSVIKVLIALNVIGGAKVVIMVAVGEKVEEKDFLVAAEDIISMKESILEIEVEVEKVVKAHILLIIIILHVYVIFVMDSGHVADN
ncbi:MAG: hypothetical protein ACK56F_07730, partial [bacterium]